MRYRARLREIADTESSAVLCESYIRSCKNCGYRYSKFAVRCNPQEDDELVCPECGESRDLCNSMAVKTRPDGIPKFKVDDEGYIVEGIPKCQYHGGKSGNNKILAKMESDRANVILDEIYEDGLREFYEDILGSDKSSLSEQMASYMITKIFAIEDDDRLSEEKKIKLQSTLHKISQDWLKSFKEMKSVDKPDDAIWMEALANRQADIQKRAYTDAVFVVLNVVKELFGTDQAEMTRDRLPQTLRELTGEIIDAEIIDND